jgi:hypothetical protein
MKQQINQNIQPVVYQNETYPLTFAYVIAQSSILNANNSPSGNITENANYCLPKGLTIAIEGPAVSVTKNVSTLTRSGTTVTATSTAHGLTTGNTVTISGASPAAFNGTFVVTVTGTNTFTYSVSSSGTDTATGTISFVASLRTVSHVAIEADRLVWITGKGAYITKEGVWIPVPEITNLLNNSTKIYSTDKNGSYLVFDTSDIADPFNQIKQLRTDEGYLVISNKAGQIPDYTWYETLDQDTRVLDQPSAVFVYDQCETNTDVNHNQKVVKLTDIEGLCDSYKKAGTTLKIKLDRLQKSHNYRIVFGSDQNNVVFENIELYYGNNQLKDLIINNNIDIVSNLVNNIITVTLHLYDNDVLVSNDAISIYVNCPPPPQSALPTMVKPRFYLIGEG